MHIRKSVTVFLIISLLNSSFFIIGCATSNYNAPEVKQEGEGNVMIYKSPNAEVNKGPVYKGPVYEGPVTIHQHSEPSFWQNKWLWIVVGGAAGYYFFSQKKDDPKSTDQSTQGYIGINW